MDNFTLAITVDYQYIGGLYLGKPFPKRSPLWEAFSLDRIREHPYCSICKCNKLLASHHKKPYHIWPELELVKSNIVVLCSQHHLHDGHLGNWKSFNPLLDKLLELWLNKPLTKRDWITIATAIKVQETYQDWDETQGLG